MSERKKKAPTRRTRAKEAPKADEKVREVKPVREEAPKHAEPAPVPTVQSRHEGLLQERWARGYSLGELASAGIGMVEAKSLGVMLDLRRRSTLNPNVERLKGWYSPRPKKERPAKPKAEKAEKPAKKRARKTKKE